MKREMIILFVVFFALILIVSIIAVNDNVGGNSECHQTKYTCDGNVAKPPCNSEEMEIDCSGSGRTCKDGACVEGDDEDDNINENQGIGQTIRNRVKAGVYTNEGGEEIRVSEMAQDRTKLKNKETEVETELEIESEEKNYKTKLKTKLSNGEYFEIKIMPNTASERALERLRLKVCSEENDCEIELKEVRQGEKIKLVYEFKAKKQGRFLGLFRMKMDVESQIDAENGEVISITKSWWAFLVAE